jgi:molybdate transport repressor ModE-like protein
MAVPLNIHVRPVWRFRNKEEREFDQTLLTLLEAIEQTGKLTEAARAARISHRHAWNLIEQWAAFFGAPLVTVKRGKGTELSELGAKLVWAGRRAHARLEPELENIAAELADTLHDPSKAGIPVLRLHASHDFSLTRLRQIANQSHAVNVDLRYRGSGEAVASLRKGTCDIAGFHVTEGKLGEYAAGRYASVLGVELYRLVSVATRVQGLIVAPGNPRAISKVQDLAKGGVRFINRQGDSGTRLLLDRLLGGAGISASEVAGYENEEHTHAAVAAHVASGLADAGLGIEAAAAQFGLGFVPVAVERYYFAAHRELFDKPEMKYLIGVMQGNEFHDTVTALHGTRPHRTGEVSSLPETAPWKHLL